MSEVEFAFPNVSLPSESLDTTWTSLAVDAGDAS